MVLKKINDSLQVKHAKKCLCVLFCFSFGSWVGCVLFENGNLTKAIYGKPDQPKERCLDQFLFIFKKHEVPIVLFDFDILSELLVPDNKSWLTFTSKCKRSCAFSLMDKTVVTFAIEAAKFSNTNSTLLNDLKSDGYAVHLSLDSDAAFLTKHSVRPIPTYLWVVKDDYVIQVAFLHKRLGTYRWIGSVQSDDWKAIASMLRLASNDSLQRITEKIRPHAQAFDTSHAFVCLPVKVNGYQLNLPCDIPAIIDEFKSSHFIECDHKRAKKYKQKHETGLKKEEKEFKVNALKLLSQAKLVLDRLKVPFSLSCGTCLGWYRQCDIIPFTTDVDIEVLIQDYNPKIIREMRNAGFRLLYKFGRLNDSFELSFLGVKPNRIKLDIFFVYEGVDHLWFSGVEVGTRKKYKYKFPNIKRCWTQFLGLKVRVPCNPIKYIEANYGKKWSIPDKKWSWNRSPPNLENNGRWSYLDKNVIKVFQTAAKRSNVSTKVKTYQTTTMKAVGSRTK